VPRWLSRAGTLQVMWHGACSWVFLNMLYAQLPLEGSLAGAGYRAGDMFGRA
jgi:hypothetical protein